MARWLRAHVTYANVVSTICLFIVLGGTSYALTTGSIDSREIKNNTIRSRDIRNNQVSSGDVRDSSLLSKDFKAGQLPQGPQGPPGEQGPTGAKGATDIRLRTTTFSLGTGGVGNSSVECQAGERVVGGGAGFAGFASGGDHVNLSAPRKAGGGLAVAGDTVTGWTATLTNEGATETAIISVLCASP